MYVSICLTGTAKIRSTEPKAGGETYYALFSFCAEHPTLCVFHVIGILHFCILQLYCPIWISAMGNSGFFSRGKPAASESRYPSYGTVHAGCFSVSIIHRSLTWTAGSLMSARD